jgi:hypothetical protein
MCGESIKRSWTIPLAHSYISSELLRRPFVRRVSFFWGGIEILLKDEQRRGELVLCLGKLIKNLFPEENVKIIPPA